jgi:hypothetical protein
MLRIRSSQKYFTEAEVASLTGICSQHLRDLARAKRIGTVASAVVAGMRAESRLFSNSDLAILASLQPRCDHDSSG